MRIRGDEQLLAHNWRPGLDDEKTLTKLKHSELLRESARLALAGTRKQEVKHSAIVRFLSPVYGQVLSIFSSVGTQMLPFSVYAFACCSHLVH